MKSKVPLSVCHTLVDYILSPHTTNQTVSTNTNTPGKDERYSALDVCALLNELHGRCQTLLEKYTTVGKTSALPVDSGIDVWCDVWKPILISLARCTQSHHANVVAEVMLRLKHALMSERHGIWLTGQQWVMVHEELVFPIVDSICQTSAAAKAQALLGSSSITQMTQMTQNSPSSTNSTNAPSSADSGSSGDASTAGNMHNNNGRLALDMLTQVVVQHAQVVRFLESSFHTRWI